jgi:hypothetical protein
VKATVINFVRPIFGGIVTLVLCAYLYHSIWDGVIMLMFIYSKVILFMLTTIDKLSKYVVE